MKSLRFYAALSWLLWATCVACAIWIYPQLPARIATHWNASGVVNGYQSRGWAVITPILTMSLLTILTSCMRWLPSVRQQSQSASFRRVFGVVMLTTQAIVLAIHLAVWLHGIGSPVAVPAMSTFGLGLVLVVSGNFLGKLPRNGLVGIRTPWTLGNDQVWERTHRQAGPWFLVTGLACMVLAGVGAPLRLATVLVLTLALWACLYSWWIARRMVSK